MAGTIAESSVTPAKNEKPVIVRVKRKAFQSPLEAFWLEINERPVKRPLLDFAKLSISKSSAKVDELKTKKVLVQHVETVSSSEVTIDILQSVVASEPSSTIRVESKAKIGERKRTFKADYNKCIEQPIYILSLCRKKNRHHGQRLQYNPPQNISKATTCPMKEKQDKLLIKAKEKQQVLSKNARFEQIWRSRKGKKGAVHGEPLRDMCHLYDVVRVDTEEPNNTVQAQKDEDLEDHRILSSFLPLLREFIPSAAEEIESEISNHTCEQVSEDDYVYDLYAVRVDGNSIMEKDSSSPFPLVQVDDDDDDYYDGPEASEYESDDSNAEDNPLNDYPDEEDDEIESETSKDESEEHESASTSDKSSEHEDFSNHEGLGDAYGLYEDDMYVDDGREMYDYDDGDDDNDDGRWSYR